MKFKLEFFAVVIFLVALYAAYFFIRHSYIIVGLAPILGVLVLAMIFAVVLATLALRFRSRS
jgi:apolipoprotein N-acyltransferase